MILSILRVAVDEVSGNTQFWYLFGGVATFLGAIIGAIVAIKKLGPEISHIQVQSAESLVAMAEQNARMSKEQADRLLLENKALDDRLTQLSQQLGAAVSRIAELETKAREVEILREEVRSLRERLEAATAEKEAAIQEAAVLRERVGHLENEIARLDSNTNGA